MTTCPKCKEELTHLNYTATDIAQGELHTDTGHRIINELDNNSVVYSCPDCCEDLFDNNEDAEEFLSSN